MAAPTPQFPIAGNQGLETLMKFVMDAKECAKRYEMLKEMAALATLRIEQTVKVKELEGAHSRMLQSEKLAAETVKVAQKKAQGMIDEAEGVVSALYADFEEVETKHKAEYEEFQREQVAALKELGHRMEAAERLRDGADADLLTAATTLTRAEEMQTEYEGLTEAMKKAMKV